MGNSRGGGGPTKDRMQPFAHAVINNIDSLSGGALGALIDRLVQ